MAELENRGLLDAGEGRPACRRPYVMEPAVFLYSLPLWAFLTLNPQYLYARLAQEAGASLDDYPHRLRQLNSSALVTHVESEAATWDVYLNLSRGIPAVLSCLVYCSLGDGLGRKLGLALPCIGGLVKSLVYTMVDYFQLSVAWLLVGLVVEGLLGYHLTVVGTGYAYLRDVVGTDRLLLRYALFNSLIVLAGTLALFASGYVIEGLGFLNTFWVMTAFYLLSLLYTLLLVPESRPPAHHHQQQEGEGVGGGCWRGVLAIPASVARALRVFSKARVGVGVRVELAILLGLIFLQSALLLGLADVITLYLMGDPFDFTSEQIGYFLSALLLIGVVWPPIFIPCFQRCMSDSIMGIIGSISGMAAFLMLALANSLGLLYSVPVVYCFADALIPLIRGMMAKRADLEEQGALHAVISSLTALGELISLTLLVGIYTASLTLFPGLVFLLVTASYVIMVFVFIVFVYRERRTVAAISEMTVAAADGR